MHCYQITSVSLGDMVSGGKSDGLDGGDTGSGDTVAANLYDLLDVSVASRKAGDLLMYDGAKWVNTPQNTLRPDLTAYLKVNGSNATNLGVSAMIRALSPASAALTDATFDCDIGRYLTDRRET